MIFRSVNVIDRDNILYNTFTCMGFSEELQASMNELIKYVVETYIDYAVKGNELDSSDLKEDNVDDIAKKYFCYALELMFSGVFPDTYQILMQSYYESKMASLAGADNLDVIRIQMLFVLYGSKLLHTGNREMFLEVANQFASNKLFDVNYYKNIMLN